jgi:hypothetical protein
MAERQIFIVGTGRSGTTILRKILGNHSRVHAFSKELRFITDANGLIDLAQVLTQNWNPFNASEAIVEFRELMLDYLWKQRAHQFVLSALYKEVLKGAARKYRFLTLQNTIPNDHCETVLDAFVNEITLEKASGSWYGSKSYQLNPTLYVTRRMEMEVLYPIMGRFVDDLLSYPLSGTKKTCWCDDTPINILNAHHIAGMLDGARLIHVYRDPRDVVASYAAPEQNWAPDDPVLSAHWVAQIMTEWREKKKSVAPEQYIEIKYEDLVANQRQHMDSLADFIGVDFEEALLDIELVERSVGRYETDISPDDLSEVTRIVGPILDEYGYATG